MDRNLGEFPVNRIAVIVEIDKAEISSRFYEFGLIPGAEVEVLTRAPWNGPICVKVNQSVLVMRKSEAESIRVK